MMEWTHLLSEDRLRRAEEKPIVPNCPFEEDQDRVCFSQPFRRLQAKTQVHPMADNDHVRTRLTHSVEVACIGQALGYEIGRRLEERHELDSGRYRFGALLRGACLAHDIGHPPFGHAGDFAIRDWFRDKIPEDVLKSVSGSELLDLQQWEGNAQSFRILTQIENHRGNGGLQLTCATLAVGMKYPWAVTSSRNIKKKFGFFESEQQYAEELTEKLGLIPDDEGGWCRHPLAYVLEAADDICYSIADLEDGIVMGSFDFDAYERLLKPFLKIGRKDHTEEYEKVAVSKAQKISYLRSKVFLQLVDECVDAFCECENELLSGTGIGDLIDKTKNGGIVSEAKAIGKERVFNHEKKQYAEIAAFEIIDGLLDAFVRAWMDVSQNSDSASFKNQRLYRLMGDMKPDEGASTYEGLMRIVDFVSGMTDRYAVGSFRQIEGIALGSLTPAPQSG